MSRTNILTVHCNHPNNMLVDIKATINKACNETCGCDRKDCKWIAYGEHEGCTGIQAVEEHLVNVEAIPVNWIEEKIKLMKQDCESKYAEVIQSLVYWWNTEQYGGGSNDSWS